MPEAVRKRILAEKDPTRLERWLDLRAYATRFAAVPLQTKRGCALKCSYCVYNNIEGHAYRLRPPSEVVDEIETLAELGADRLTPGKRLITQGSWNVPLGNRTLSLYGWDVLRRADSSNTSLGVIPPSAGRRQAWAARRSPP